MEVNCDHILPISDDEGDEEWCLVSVAEIQDEIDKSNSDSAEICSQAHEIGDQCKDSLLEKEEPLSNKQSLDFANFDIPCKEDSKLRLNEGLTETNGVLLTPVSGFNTKNQVLSFQEKKDKLSERKRTILQLQDIYLQSNYLLKNCIAIESVEDSLDYLQAEIENENDLTNINLCRNLLVTSNVDNSEANDTNEAIHKSVFEPSKYQGLDLLFTRTPSLKTENPISFSKSNSTMELGAPDILISQCRQNGAECGNNLKSESQTPSYQQLDSSYNSDKEEKVSENEVITIHISDNDEKVNHISDNYEKVGHISDNYENVSLISDNSEKVGHISDNDEKVDHISDNDEKVNHISNDYKKVSHISDNDEITGNISDNDEKVGIISDNVEKVSCISNIEEIVNNISDKKEIVKLETSIESDTFLKLHTSYTPEIYFSKQSTDHVHSLYLPEHSQIFSTDQDSNESSLQDDNSNFKIINPEEPLITDHTEMTGNKINQVSNSENNDNNPNFPELSKSSFSFDGSGQYSLTKDHFVSENWRLNYAIVPSPSSPYSDEQIISEGEISEIHDDSIGALKNMESTLKDNLSLTKLDELASNNFLKLIPGSLRPLPFLQELHQRFHPSATIDAELLSGHNEEAPLSPMPELCEIISNKTSLKLNGKIFCKQASYTEFNKLSEETDTFIDNLFNSDVDFDLQFCDENSTELTLEDSTKLSSFHDQITQCEAETTDNSDVKQWQIESYNSSHLGEETFPDIVPRWKMEWDGKRYKLSPECLAESPIRQDPEIHNTKYSGFTRSDCSESDWMTTSEESFDSVTDPEEDSQAFDPESNFTTRNCDEYKWKSVHNNLFKTPPIQKLDLLIGSENNLDEKDIKLKEGVQVNESFTSSPDHFSKQILNLNLGAIFVAENDLVKTGGAGNILELSADNSDSSVLGDIGKLCKLENDGTKISTEESFGSPNYYHLNAFFNSLKENDCYREDAAKHLMEASMNHNLSDIFISNINNNDLSPMEDSTANTIATSTYLHLGDLFDSEMELCSTDHDECSCESSSRNSFDSSTCLHLVDLFDSESGLCSVKLSDLSTERSIESIPYHNLEALFSPGRAEDYNISPMCHNLDTSITSGVELYDHEYSQKELSEDPLNSPLYENIGAFFSKDDEQCATEEDVWSMKVNSSESPTYQNLDELITNEGDGSKIDSLEDFVQSTDNLNLCDFSESDIELCSREDECSIRGITEKDSAISMNLYLKSPFVPNPKLKETREMQNTNDNNMSTLYTNLESPFPLEIEFNKRENSLQYKNQENSFESPKCFSLDTLLTSEDGVSARNDNECFSEKTAKKSRECNVCLSLDTFFTSKDELSTKNNNECLSEETVKKFESPPCIRLQNFTTEDKLSIKDDGECFSEETVKSTESTPCLNLDAFFTSENEHSAKNDNESFSEETLKKSTESPLYLGLDTFFTSDDGLSIKDDGECFSEETVKSTESPPCLSLDTFFTPEDKISAKNDNECFSKETLKKAAESLPCLSLNTILTSDEGLSTKNDGECFSEEKVKSTESPPCLSLDTFFTSEDELSTKNDNECLSEETVKKFIKSPPCIRLQTFTNEDKLSIKDDGECFSEETVKSTESPPCLNLDAFFTPEDEHSAKNDNESFSEETLKKSTVSPLYLGLDTFFTSNDGFSIKDDGECFSEETVKSTESPPCLSLDTFFTPEDKISVKNDNECFSEETLKKSAESLPCLSLNTFLTSDEGLSTKNKGECFSEEIVMSTESSPCLSLDTFTSENWLSRMNDNECFSEETVKSTESQPCLSLDTFFTSEDGLSNDNESFSKETVNKSLKSPLSLSLDAFFTPEKEHSAKNDNECFSEEIIKKSTESPLYLGLDTVFTSDDGLSINDVGECFSEETVKSTESPPCLSLDTFFTPEDKISAKNDNECLSEETLKKSAESLQCLSLNTFLTSDEGLSTKNYGECFSEEKVKSTESPPCLSLDTFFTSEDELSTKNDNECLSEETVKKFIKSPLCIRLQTFTTEDKLSIKDDSECFSEETVKSTESPPCFNLDAFFTPENEHSAKNDNKSFSEETLKKSTESPLYLGLDTFFTSDDGLSIKDDGECFSEETVKSTESPPCLSLDTFFTPEDKISVKNDNECFSEETLKKSAESLPCLSLNTFLTSDEGLSTKNKGECFSEEIVKSTESSPCLSLDTFTSENWLSRMNDNECFSEETVKSTESQPCLSLDTFFTSEDGLSNDNESFSKETVNKSLKSPLSLSLDAFFTPEKELSAKNDNECFSEEIIKKSTESPLYLGLDTVFTSDDELSINDVGECFSEETVKSTESPPCLSLDTFFTSEDELSTKNSNECFSDETFKKSTESPPCLSLDTFFTSQEGLSRKKDNECFSEETDKKSTEFTSCLSLDNLFTAENELSEKNDIGCLSMKTEKKLIESYTCPSLNTLTPDNELSIKNEISTSSKENRKESVESPICLKLGTFLPSSDDLVSKSGIETTVKKTSIDVSFNEFSMKNDISCSSNKNVKQSIKSPVSLNLDTFFTLDNELYTNYNKSRSHEETINASIESPEFHSLDTFFTSNNKLPTKHDKSCSLQKTVNESFEFPVNLSMETYNEATPKNGESCSLKETLRESNGTPDIGLRAKKRKLNSSIDSHNEDFIESPICYSLKNFFNSDTELHTVVDNLSITNVDKEENSESPAYHSLETFFPTDKLGCEETLKISFNSSNKQSLSSDSLSCAKNDTFSQKRLPDVNSDFNLFDHEAFYFEDIYDFENVDELGKIKHLDNQLGPDPEANSVEMEAPSVEDLHKCSSPLPNNTNLDSIVSFTKEIGFSGNDIRNDKCIHEDSSVLSNSSDSMFTSEGEVNANEGEVFYYPALPPHLSSEFVNNNNKEDEGEDIKGTDGINESTNLNNILVSNILEEDKEEEEDTSDCDSDSEQWDDVKALNYIVRESYKKSGEENLEKVCGRKKVDMQVFKRVIKEIYALKIALEASQNTSTDDGCENLECHYMDEDDVFIIPENFYEIKVDSVIPGYDLSEKNEDTDSLTSASTFESSGQEQDTFFPTELSQFPKNVDVNDLNSILRESYESSSVAKDLDVTELSYKKCEKSCQTSPSPIHCDKETFIDQNVTELPIAYNLKMTPDDLRLTSRNPHEVDDVIYSNGKYCIFKNQINNFCNFFSSVSQIFCKTGRYEGSVANTFKEGSPPLHINDKAESLPMKFEKIDASSLIVEKEPSPIPFYDLTRLTPHPAEERHSPFPYDGMVSKLSTDDGISILSAYDGSSPNSNFSDETYTLSTYDGPTPVSPLSGEPSLIYDPSSPFSFVAEEDARYNNDNSQEEFMTGPEDSDIEEISSSSSHDSESNCDGNFARWKDLADECSQLTTALESSGNQRNNNLSESRIACD